MSTPLVVTGFSVPTSKQDNWGHYKHTHVDPIAPHEQPSAFHSDVDTKQRAIADEFWSKEFQDEKEHFHDMMAKETKAGGSLFVEQQQDPQDETWDHYKHEYIDPDH